MFGFHSGRVIHCSFNNSPMLMGMDALQLQQQHDDDLARISDSLSYRWLLNIKPAADHHHLHLHHHASSSSSTSLDIDDGGGGGGGTMKNTNYLLQQQYEIERRSCAACSDSNFNFPSTTLHHQQQQPSLTWSSSTFLHADQLFSNGLLMPLQLFPPPPPPALFQTPPPVHDHLSDSDSDSDSNSNSTSTANVSSNNMPTYSSHSQFQFSAGSVSQNLIPSHLPQASPSPGPPQSSQQFINYCRPSRWYWSSKRIFRKCLRFFLRPLYMYRKPITPLPPVSMPMVNCVESLQATPRTSCSTITHDYCCHTHTNFLFQPPIDNLIYDAVLHCKKSAGEIHPTTPAC